MARFNDDEIDTLKRTTDLAALMASAERALSEV